MPDPTTQHAAALQPTTGQAVAAMSGSRDQFLMHVLSAQCQLAPAEGGAVLFMPQADTVQIEAVFPSLEDQTAAPPWLAKAAELVGGAVEAGESQLIPLARSQELYGQSPDTFLLLIPAIHNAHRVEIAVFHLHGLDGEALMLARSRLEMTAALLSHYDMQASLQRTRANLQRMRTAMEITAQVSEHDRFRAAAMALCNEAAARWSAQRVSLGILQGRYIKIKAISHTDRFSRKMRLVQDLEAAMEECFDQDLEIVHPAPADANYVSRATAQCSAHHGPFAMCSLPMRRQGQAQAVLTVEREIDRPFTVQEVEAMRLTADLAAGWMLHLFDTDRWLGARIAQNVKRGAGQLVGPTHTWAKLSAILLLAAILFLTFAHGTDRVEAPFEVQPPQLRHVVAPFDGRLMSVHVKPNDLVVAGQTVLAEFDVSDLELERIALAAEQDSYLKEQSAALSAGRSSEAQIAKARADMIAARIALIGSRIQQARVIAPISGQVLSGDLERQVNGQFERGAMLFEIAPLHAAEAELSVPEHRVGDLLNELNRRRETGDDRPLRGELATAANPGVYIPFEVYRIDAVAEVVAQRNVFRVYVRLAGTPEQIDGLKKGMQGVAKIDIDRKRYVTIWTRDVRNWLRMWLWV